MEGEIILLTGVDGENILNNIYKYGILLNSSQFPINGSKIEKIKYYFTFSGGLSGYIVCSGIDFIYYEGGKLKNIFV